MKRIITSCLLILIVGCTQTPPDYTGLTPVADTVIDVEHGFFQEPFTVTISCDEPGATIMYTLDGSVPYGWSGTKVKPQGEGGAKTELQIDQTTVLRATAYKKGFAPSPLQTATYIFVDDVVKQTSETTRAAGFPKKWRRYLPDYGMDPDVVGPNDRFDGLYTNTVKAALYAVPTISIVMEGRDLWHNKKGIYVNPEEKGVEWERPCSVEYIRADGEKGFQIDCGIRIQGGTFRSMDYSKKKSFRLLFKNEYGPGKLDYPLFGKDGVKSFDTVTLRMDAHDGWTWDEQDKQLYVRDQFSRDLQRSLGHASARGNRAHLYINGVYWGLYNPVERPDASFTAAYLGGEKKEWDNLNGAKPVNVGGDQKQRMRVWSQWKAMLSLCQEVVKAPNEIEQVASYMYVLGRDPDGTRNPEYQVALDIDNYIDYLITEFFIGKEDWPMFNYYSARRRHAQSRGWQFFTWDGEISMLLDSSLKNDRSKLRLGVLVPFQDLRKCKEFTVRFADRVHRAFFNEGPLYVDPENPQWDPEHPERNRPAKLFVSLTEPLALPLVAESARWGDAYRSMPFTVQEDWAAVRDVVLTHYLPQRSGIVLDQFRKSGLYPELDAPAFAQHGGLFEPGFALAVSAPKGTIYYTTDGSDPRQIGGEPAGKELIGPITLNQTTQVKARAYNGVDWSALNEAWFNLSGAAPAVQISELMYHARDDGKYDYVELHNPGDKPAPLAGFAFTEGIRFNFDKSHVEAITPGGYVILAKDIAAFTERYPDTTIPVAGSFEGKLDNGGEQISLTQASTGFEISFTYDDGRHWPAQADGAGHSLVPAESGGGGLNHPESWRASSFIDGSPGKADPPPGATLVLNEFAAHTDHPTEESNDWIELFNPGQTPVSLKDWYLTDDADALKKWALPESASAAPGAWVSFDELTGFHQKGKDGFGLNKAGEEIFLSHLPGEGPNRVADAIRFEGQPNGVTLGRHPDGSGVWAPGAPTRDAGNQVAASTIVIEEIMYHPEESDQPEYVLLANRSDRDIRLNDQAGPWRLVGEAEITFDPNTTLAPGDKLLVVPFKADDEAARSALLAAYGSTDPAFKWAGPFKGKLSNQAGDLSLEMPQMPDQDGDDISWIVVSDVIYSDSAPWPSEADGEGSCLKKNGNRWKADKPLSGE